MRIELYFHAIRNAIDASPIVSSSNVTYDKRSTHEGFIRGEVYFFDGSVLHFREFVDVEITPDRLMYAYQYLGPQGEFIFRYDNSGHYRKLSLASHPHHKHEGSEDNVIASSAPDLAAVLNEIESRIQLP